jgi:phenylalanyl-tRNA synthetase alpha chain
MIGSRSHNVGDMADVFGQIASEQEQALNELNAVASADALEQFRIKYLGTKGKLKDLMKLLGSAAPSDRPALGQKVNAVKEAITSAFEAKKQAIDQAASSGRDAIDVTEPGSPIVVGRPHVITKVTEELLELFGKLGFTVAAGPELEDEWHNFVALNIPASHPARDPNDNFYLAGDREGQISTSLLRTQTSTVQIRIMETQKPPLRVVIPGRVYRPDTTDATHLPMFHQLEALVVDEGVTMVDLKSTILQFVRGYIGDSARVRFRPSFFPFTEPSAEIDVWFEEKQRWIELGGCGMVHPNVLKNCGIDAERYTGWAFGFGIERIAMRKYAIPDIRMLVENDVRFLVQF